MISQMMRESAEIPSVIRRQLETDDANFRNLVGAIQNKKPTTLVTVARGSSEHSACYFRYALSSSLGLLPCSLPLSTITIDSAELNFAKCLVIAVSQSGESPDLVEVLQNARERGAITCGIVNNEDSPLGRTAEFTFGTKAGVEASVAATKTFMANLSLCYRLWGYLLNEADNISQLKKLATLLEAPLSDSFDRFTQSASDAHSIVVLSRGLNMASAREAALKLNETCGMVSSYFSTAEFKHGPMALASTGVPILVIGTRGPAFSSIQRAVKELREKGAQLFYLAPSECPTTDVLPDCHYPAPEDWRLDPIVAIRFLYPVIAQISKKRGYNPDSPPLLSKVTHTI